ncbi:hypothetical protein [Halobellus salinisoli]|uniref:hypothetical protein n=1 Tax=Halobellus salinisoli TaxID=3108500 RepID=UPI00300AC2D8
MTDCTDWLSDLTHAAEIVLDEDLAALEKMPESSRIDRYEEIKGNEETLLWDFSKECSDFVTDAEREHLRGQLRLARLLLAASLFDDGDLPDELADDFIEAELRAVIEFDEYKQFDVLSEEQIEGRIRRMEGEVYELVTEYTSTQIANIDELVDNPDVQQDVIEKLVDRYDERREKIRQGFFVYVETHGLEHMVDAIEDAVTAVSAAATERETVRDELRTDLSELSSELASSYDQHNRQFQREARQLEQQLASPTADDDSVAAQLEQIRAERAEVSQAESRALERLDAQIERTNELETRLEQQVSELEAVREETANADREAARNEATELVESEIENLHEEQTTIRTELERLETKRGQIELHSDRLDDREAEFAAQIESTDAPVDTDAGAGVTGDELVTATIARLLELDYLGRFDTAMHELTTLNTADGPFDVPEGYWDGRSQRTSDRPKLNDLLLAGEEPSDYPTNQTARYEITDSKYFGLGAETRMVVEAMVFAHLDAYATNEFDTQPADLDDLLSLVNDAVYEAENGDYTYLLAIASPTGWTDRVRRQIAADDLARTHYSRQVSVCLVDLQSGELIYDGSDPLVSENADIFEPAIDAERIDACERLIREKYLDDVTCESVLLEELLADHGIDSHVVKRAFNRLETEGEGEQLYVDDVGLALYLE